LPKSKTMYTRIANWPNDLPDHPGQSKQSRFWMPPSRPLLLRSQLQNTEFLNMPPETGAGNALHTNIQCQFKTSSSRISKPDDKNTNYWVRESRKLCHNTN
jgi:hypothetical protein